MEATKENHLDKLALALCLGGVILAVAVVAFGAVVNRNLMIVALGACVAFQIAAFVLGIITSLLPAWHASRYSPVEAISKI